jgi:hypothetical protein
MIEREKQRPYVLKQLSFWAGREMYIRGSVKKKDIAAEAFVLREADNMPS